MELALEAEHDNQQETFLETQVTATDEDIVSDSDSSSSDSDSSDSDSENEKESLLQLEEGDYEDIWASKQSLVEKADAKHPPPENMWDEEDRAINQESVVQSDAVNN